MANIFLRPDSNITQNNFTNGYAEIDEASVSDANVDSITSIQRATLTLKIRKT